MPAALPAGAADQQVTLMVAPSVSVSFDEAGTASAGDSNVGVTVTRERVGNVVVTTIAPR